MKNYEEKQLTLIDKMILNINQSSKWKITISYIKNDITNRYTLTIKKWKNCKYPIVKEFREFNDFIDYICNFWDIYFLLKR